MKTTTFTTNGTKITDEIVGTSYRLRRAYRDGRSVSEWFPLRGGEANYYLFDSSWKGLLDDNGHETFVMQVTRETARMELAELLA